MENDTLPFPISECVCVLATGSPSNNCLFVFTIFDVIDKSLTLTVAVEWIVCRWKLNHPEREKNDGAIEMIGTHIMHTQRERKL